MTEHPPLSERARKQLLQVSTATLTTQLFKRGFRNLFVQGIRPPTVPAGSARLRLSLSATHRPEHLDRLLSAITALRTELL